MTTYEYRHIAAVLAVMAAVLLPASLTRAQGNQARETEPMVVSGLDESGRIRLTPGKSVVITTRRPQKTISVGSPDVIDVTGISPTRILATAKKTGTTQILVWDQQDNSQSIDVVVTADVSGLREQLDRLFPDSKIEAAASEDSIVLRGRVASLSQAEQAALLAAPYGKSVVNLIEIIGGQQVLLQVRVAEVSRTATQALGVNFGFTDGTAIGASNIGKISPFSLVGIGNSGDIALGVPPIPGDDVTILGSGEIGNTAFDFFLAALRENNMLRILAEPNLVAMSGQEASFLAGGEFPIPVPQSGTADTVTITIEFKEFGVRLTFVPVVLGDGRIRLKLSPEVSDLDFTTAVQFSGFVVPGLTQRRVTTTVEMREGESLAIAGLLSQNVTSNKSVTPVLGDIPVLGALFRSVRYQRKETELVVMITPRLINGTAPGDVPALPGEFWRHPDEFNLFLHGNMGGPMAGAPTTQPAHDRRRAPRAFAGSYGFAPAPMAPEPSAAPAASN